MARQQLAVSTTFASDNQLRSVRPDLVVQSSDNMQFHVHANVLESASTNGFDGLVGHSPSTSASACVMYDPSAILDILLRVIYNVGDWQQKPSTEVLTDAVDRFEVYGISPAAYIFSVPPTAASSRVSSPLFELILERARADPLEMYALAAKYDLHDLAATMSEHLLKASMDIVTDELAIRMGALYLRKLQRLLQGRTDAFKRITSQPPPSHEPTSTCDAQKHERLVVSWRVAIWELARDTDTVHDISATTLESALNSLMRNEQCAMCHANTCKCIQDVVSQWLAVKKTID